MIRLEALTQTQNLTYLRDLLFELTLRDIKVRYKRSVLGIVWSLLNSLAQMRIFRFIFGSVLAVNVPNYTAFLFIGILVWVWFRSGLTQATLSITGNRELVTRPGFPSAVLPVITVMTSLVDFLLAFPILIFFLVAGGSQLTASLLLLPVVMVIQFALTLGLAYILATIQVTFRDMGHLLNVVLSLGFYLTPVFYDVSSVPERYQFIYKFNPMVYLLAAYRKILLEGELPATLPLLALSMAAGLLLYIGYTVFVRASYRFVEEL
jgi:lipopolysaccharide transport system permease protein